MKIVVPGAENAAREALDRLGAGQRRVAIVGPQGCGKSAALARARELLPKDARVISLAFPRTGDDAALVVLCALATELDADEPGLVAEVTDPKTPWDAKLARCRARLEAIGPTLFIDDATPEELHTTASIFERRRAELSDTLLMNRAIIASRTSALPRPITLETRSQPASILKNNPAWTGLLAPAAAELGKVTSELSRYSPLEVKLAIAAVAAGQSVSAITSRRRSPRELVSDALCRAEGDELRKLVARLALCRTPIDDKLLELLGKNRLSGEALVVLHNIVLIRGPEGQYLHDLIGGVARDSGWLDRNGVRDAHETLAAWHKAAFVAASAQQNVQRALRSELEVIHHLTAAGNADGVLKAAVYFPEQLDALGKSLSLDKRYEEAVTAYERALDYDPNDAYAHHYIAWNLDVVAGDEGRIFDAYTTARALQDDHVWYHGRRISFLVTTGRLDEARDAFGEALAALPQTLDVTSELHRPLAQLLLHRGELAFAADVLGDAEPIAFESAWFRALSTLLGDLRDARAERLVFPPGIEVSRRWEGPHLLRDDEDREQIASWMPGRISGAEEEGIRVRLGELVDGAPRFFYRDIPIEELRALTNYALHLPEGTFVELLRLKSGEEKLLSWPRGARSMPDLTAIFPPPDRYLRRAFAGR